MPEILDMATSFKKKSNEQAQAINDRAQNVLKKLERNWEDALKQNSATLTNAINAQNEALRATIKEQTDQTQRLALKSWVSVLLVIGMMLALSAGALWWMGQELTDTAQELKQAKENLAYLESKGSKIEIKSCGEQRRLCIQIDETAPTYQNGHRIVMGY